LRRDPNYAFAKQNLAKAYNNYGLQLTRNPRSAIKQFHKALWLNPEDTAAAQNLDNVLIEMKKAPGSFADRFDLAKQADSEKDYSGAAVELLFALRIKDSATAHDYLAKMYTALGELAKAQDESKKGREAAKWEEKAKANAAARDQEREILKTREKELASKLPEKLGSGKGSSSSALTGVQTKPAQGQLDKSKSLTKTLAKASETGKAVPNEIGKSAPCDTTTVSPKGTSPAAGAGVTPEETIKPVLPAPFVAPAQPDMESDIARAEIFAKANDLSEAINSYSRALRLKPDDRRVLDGLVAAWDAALKLNPLAPENHIGIAQAYAYRGEIGMAEKELRVAQRLSPRRRNPTAERLLKDVFWSGSGKSNRIPEPPFAVSPVMGR
jgi:tetratricopeptide (TPR) repeat protein